MADYTLPITSELPYGAIDTLHAVSEDARLRLGTALSAVAAAGGGQA